MVVFFFSGRVDENKNNVQWTLPRKAIDIYIYVPGSKLPLFPYNRG